MLNSLHPIRLLTRTDAEVNTLFHSFFLIEYLKNSDDIRVVERIPRERPKIDIIEQGLKLFVIESAAKSIHEELGGGFAVTTSDGSRYFAFFRCFDSRLFVAVSSLPSMQFSRTVFELLEFEDANTLLPTLLALTEIPIFPGPGLQYDIELAKGTASLKFSTAEQAEDADVDLMVLNLLSPMMMVKAWESIILERKVLVVSNVDSVIAPCCEFLRKMALPLVIVNTFVPLLPLLLINTVEAPFPYLLGANTTMLKENMVDLSDTVIIDLDTRSVTMPKNKSAASTCVASSNMVARIVQEINTIMLTPLGSWFNRPSSGYTGGRHQKAPMYNPRQDEFYNRRATQILQVFVNANLSLVSARNCALRAFFRRPNSISDETYVDLESIPVKKSLNNMGFDYRNGVYSGYMQLSKGVTVGDDMLQHFVPTWSEMDAFVLSIYEYADDLPLIYIPNKDLESVSPCPVEPEGHVFEIVTKDQTTYRFTATDSESRRQWIQAIEEKMRIAEAAANASVGIADTSGRTGNSGVPQSPLPANSTRSDPSLSMDTSAMLDDGGGSEGGAGGGGSNAINQANSALGLPLPSIEEVESDAVVKEEAGFRFFFMKTQMLTTLLHQVECDEFEAVFKEQDVKMTSLMGDLDAFEERVSKFLWKSGTVTALLQQIKDSADGVKAEVSGSGSISSASGHKEKVTFHAHSSKTGQPLHKAASTNSMESETTADTASINSFVSEKATTHRNSIALNPRPSSMTCNVLGTAGTTTSTGGEKKKGFLGSLFHRNSTKESPKSEEFEKYDEFQREAEAQKLRDKAQEDRAIQAIRAKVFVIISSYRRCQMELQKAIVESRLESMGNVMRRSLDNKPGASLPPIAFNVSKLVNDTSNASFYNGLNNLTSLNTTINAVAATGSVTNGSSAVTGEAVHPSLHWYDHLWLSIVGKTWQAYRSENPENSGPSPTPPPPTPPTVTGGGTATAEEALPEPPVFDSDDDDVPSRRQSRASEVKKDPVSLSALQTAHQDQLRKDIREKLITVMCDQLVKSSEPNAPPFRPILQLLVGFVHETQGEHEEAIQAYCEGQLVDYKRLMACLVTEFLARVGDKSEKFDELKFISWAYDVNPVLGLHAYRLIIEILYREQLVKLNVDFNMDKFLALGSFRTYPGSHWNTQKKDSNGLLQRASANGATDFTWVENDTKSENLNESVICKSINSNTSPCELSVQLLSRLREILRTYCQSPAGQKLCKKTPAGSLKLKITSAMIEELATSSAFRAFEVNCCQLQKVDLSQLSNRQRVLFFCNVFNTITVHALILKGTPGNNLLERSAFMRSSKYNLGGLVYSLLDIEHGILRNASTKPMIFGPLTISISFADKDPRKAFALEDPWPNVSFCLFSACVSSPALVVLKDFNTVESEMKRHTRKYFQEHVKIDPVQKSVELPGLMRIYWSDFGGNRSKVLKIISQMSGPQFAADMRPYLVEGVKPKVEFAQLDWTPMIIL